MLEFATPRGLAYAQYACDGVEGEQLLRILPGYYPERPRDLDAVAGAQERFWEQVEISALLEDDFAVIAGVAEVPPRARRHPRFRSPGLPNPFTGTVDTWRIWDDRRVEIVAVHELTDEQRALSLGGVATRLDLLDRIAGDWSPSVHRLEPIAPRPDAHLLRMTHVLRYKRPDPAKRAAAAVEAAGFSAVTIEPEDGEWVVTGQEPALSWDQRRSERSLERIARDTGGEYEGYDYPEADVLATDETDGAVEHTLVFSAESAAREAAQRLSAPRFATTITATPGQWLVTAREALATYDPDLSDDMFDEIAAAYGGDYLGDEVQLRPS